MSLYQNFFANLPDIIKYESTLVDIATKIIGCVCALKGIGYLNALRQKKAIATFSFSAQLYVRLYELNIFLSANEQLLTNLYSENAQSEWGDKRGAPENELTQFYECAEETLNFIKISSDQMPSYKDWEEDYMNLIQFLVDIIFFDIRDGKNRFKYTENCSIDDRTHYWQNKCDLLQKLLSGIKEEKKKKAREILDNDE